MHTVLIDCATLREQLERPDWTVVDCRFDLTDTEAGRRAYEQGHVPGALYAHLDDDLSGPPVTDHGRHPLPTPARLRETFGCLGIDGSRQVVAYDTADAGIAARLWWLLRYMGHEAVAVLDGGFRAWEAAGLPREAGRGRSPAPTTFSGAPRPQWVVGVDEVASAPLMVDLRDGARFRGETEPFDPVAGHIPGAVSHPYTTNVDADGAFLPAHTLRERLLATLGGVDPASAVFYCGSGVTACQGLLALAHAGLPAGRLYAGSWSDWCRDPARPVATGDAGTEK